MEKVKGVFVGLMTKRDLELLQKNPKKFWRGVSVIGSRAFGNYTSLETIIIPDSVNIIEGNAFSCCLGLKSVEIAEGVTKIGDSAFTFCESLPSITIPSSVKEIGEWAFKGCKSLETITIPDSVEKIGKDVLKDCKNLKAIYISHKDGSIEEIRIENFKDAARDLEWVIKCSRQTREHKAAVAEKNKTNPAIAAGVTTAPFDEVNKENVDKSTKRETRKGSNGGMER